MQSLTPRHLTLPPPQRHVTSANVQKPPHPWRRRLSMMRWKVCGECARGDVIAMTCLLEWIFNRGLFLPIGTNKSILGFDCVACSGVECCLALSSTCYSAVEMFWGVWNLQWKWAASCDVHVVYSYLAGGCFQHFASAVIDWVKVCWVWYCLLVWWNWLCSDRISCSRHSVSCPGTIWSWLISDQIFKVLLLMK